MAAHSKIGASSMERWENCPGSVRLSEGIPSKSSVYAEEGTRAHDLAAFLLETGGQPGPQIESEMTEAVMVYVNFIRTEFVSKNHYGIDLDSEDFFLIEKKFDLSSLYPGLFGTADCVIYNSETKILKVIDYKHGSGIPVEVENNRQLLYYGLGAALTLNIPINEVELVIVQPRCNHSSGPIRKFRVDGIAMLDFAADLVEAARRTQEQDSPLNPGDWCRFCPAAGVCPCLHSNAQLIAKEEFSPATTYDPDKLSKALSWLPIMEGWIKNVRDFAYQEALHGRTPPGYKLVQKRAMRKWRNEENAIEYLERFEPEQIFTRKLKSPAQLEKILSKAAISELTIKESSGTTLVQESDSRDSLRLGAKSEFSVI